RVRLDRGKHVIVRELMSRVDDQAVEGPEAKRLLLDDLEVLPRLAEIDGEGDDLRGVLVLDPLEHHRCVETAGIEEQHATDLLRTGLIGGRHRSGRTGARDCLVVALGGVAQSAWSRKSSTRSTSCSSITSGGRN